MAKKPDCLKERLLDPDLDTDQIAQKAVKSIPINRGAFVSAGRSGKDIFLLKLLSPPTHTREAKLFPCPDPGGSV